MLGDLEGLENEKSWRLWEWLNGGRNYG